MRSAKIQARPRMRNLVEIVDVRCICGHDLSILAVDVRQVIYVYRRALVL